MCKNNASDELQFEIKSFEEGKKNLQNDLNDFD